MMNNDNYILKELDIRNYKFIRQGKYNLADKNLVILDGPNGYGKTTLFDAIEVIIVGKPRRINEDGNILANYAYTDSPIHNDNSLPIQLKLSLVNQSGDDLSIIRTFDPTPDEKSRLNNPQKIYENSSLKIILNEEELDISINDALQYFDVKLFNVFNYVEQDENTFFLKKNPKDKYKSLAGLLGVEDQISHLEKLGKFLKMLEQKVASIESLIKEKQEEIKVLLQFDDNVKFEKLFSEVEIAWDNDEFKVTSTEIREGVQSDIESLQYLIDNRDEVPSILKRLKLLKFSNNDEFISDVVDFYWFINNIESIDKENEQRRRLNREIDNSRKVIEAIDKFDFENLKAETAINAFQEIELFSEDKDRFVALVDLILTLRESLSAENKILEVMKNRRDSLLEHYEEFHESLNLKESECPVCGFDWESHQELINKIEATEIKIFESLNENSKRLEEEKTKLKEDFLNQFKDFLQSKIETLTKLISELVDIEFYEKIKEKELLLNSDIMDLLDLLDENLAEEIVSALNKRNHEDKDSVSDLVRSLITQDMPGIDSTIKLSQIQSDFKRFFDENLEALNSFEENKLKDKLNYIDFLFHSHVTSSIDLLERRVIKLRNVDDEVIEIRRILDETVKDYLTNIIATISIPFYIYTGKILQEHSLGSGLIFDADINNVEPQIKIKPLNREQEASYTLSSGQLSATVISLMLVLNKVYNTSKLGTILIDDPVQTLDEINTHSLVELLKYNFNDQQIIMSTHEDRYSKFIRYKFDKFGLTSKNLNMKNLYS